MFVLALLLVILRKPIPLVVFVSDAVFFFIVLFWSLFKNRAINHLEKNGQITTFRIILSLVITIINFLSGIFACQITNEVSFELFYEKTFVYMLLFSSIVFLLINIADLTSQLVRDQHKPQIGINVTITLFQIVQFFAIVYAYIYSLNNTSFKGIPIGNPLRMFIDFMYFSTITFTTLGFGDITPVSSAAKIVVMFEVLLFAIYISIILLNLANNRHREISSEVSPNAEISSDSNSHEGESSKNDN